MAHLYVTVLLQLAAKGQVEGLCRADNDDNDDQEEGAQTAGAVSQGAGQLHKQTWVSIYRLQVCEQGCSNFEQIPCN